MTDARPARGPRIGGVPAAIGLSPILRSRYGPEDLERIRAAAPGTRLVSVAPDGSADGPLDDVEVLLRGSGLGGETLERVLSRAPLVSWIHSASVGVEQVLTPTTLGRASRSSRTGSPASARRTSSS